MRAALLALLARFSFLCLPPERFTEAELQVLQAEYRKAPSEIPRYDFEWFQVVRNTQVHIDALLLVMRNHPTWVLGKDALAILNAERTLTRRIGFGVYKLLTEGADCPCCSGWRAILMAAAAAVASSAVTLAVTRSASWFH